MEAWQGPLVLNKGGTVQYQQFPLDHLGCIAVGVTDAGFLALLSLSKNLEPM